MRIGKIAATAISFAFTCSLVGCGGGSSSSTPVQPTQPVTPTGPASGTEFLYSFYNFADVQVATLNPSTGEPGPTVDATPGYFPTFGGTESEYYSLNVGAVAQYGNFIYVVGFDQLYVNNYVWTLLSGLIWLCRRQAHWHV